MSPEDKPAINVNFTDVMVIVDASAALITSAKTDDGAKACGPIFDRYPLYAGILKMLEEVSGYPVRVTPPSRPKIPALYLDANNMEVYDEGN